MIKRANTRQPQHLKLWVYGVGGSGKSRLAASAALDNRTAPVLMLDFAGNPVSFADYAQQPDVITLTDMGDLNTVYNWLAQGQAPGKFTEELGLKPPYKTLVVDTVTEFQRQIMTHVIGSQSLGPGDIPPAVERQHFGRILATLTNFCRRILLLPMHIIITAQEDVRYDATTGQVASIDPLIWGSSDREVAGYAYAVGRLSPKETLEPKVMKALADRGLVCKTNLLQFTPSARTPLLKNQYTATVPFLVDPDVKSILDAVLHVS